MIANGARIGTREEMMKIKGKVIYFKSSSELFSKELKGIKNNTVRELTFEEHNQLENILVDGDDPELICIESIETGVSFVRELTDISFYANRWIFTWRCNYAAN